MTHDKHFGARALLPAAALVAALSSVAVGNDIAFAQGRTDGTTHGQRGRYADGDYTATGEYGGQPSHISVTLTLDGGVIRKVSVATHATVPRSLQLQRAFAKAVPRVVVGRPIDQVRVGKLAGSSGTPKGFNDAIRQIREQARRD